MPKARPQDLRQRVIEAVEEHGTSRRAAARRFGVSDASAIERVRRHRPAGARGPGRAWPMASIDGEPDITLLEAPPRRRGVHHSARKLEEAALGDIETVDADPRPFRSTPSADDILATIERFRLRTLEAADNRIEIVETSRSGH